MQNKNEQKSTLINIKYQILDRIATLFSFCLYYQIPYCAT